MILTTHIVQQIKVSLRTGVQADQSNASLINIHNFNSHLSPENTIKTKDFIEKYSTPPQNQSSSNVNKTSFCLNPNIQYQAL